MGRIVTPVPGEDAIGLDADGLDLPTAALEQALMALRERLRDYQETISELRERSQRAAEEERLLQRLIALRRGEILPEGQVERQSALPSSTSMDSVPLGRRAVDQVVAILETTGHPVHVSELMRVLRERNVDIPGSGTQANLISHMSRDARIVRPARGMYGLAEWGLEEMHPVPVKKARRRRVRRTATSSKEK